MQEYAKYINETTLSWRIPWEVDYEGRHYSGDLTQKPEILLSLGFLPVIDDPNAEIQEETAGKHLEERFSLGDGVILRSWVLVDDPPLNRSLSKRKLMNHLKAQGVWEQVKAFMSANGFWEDWEASTTLDEQEQMMQTAITALKNAFGFSDELVEELIAGSTVD